MSINRNKNSKRSSGDLDYIMDEYKRNEKKIMENRCVTGSDTDESDTLHFKHQRVRKIVTILTQFSLVLGFLVFLLLWLL